MQIKKLVTSVFTMGSVLVLSACQQPMQPTKEAYWQRIETNSALYLTGPKAQQMLDQDIAGCTNEIKELVELQAIRKTTPPATHYAYHSALEKSGDLAEWETPSHVGDLRVDHTEYHDFESCMRMRGWERVQNIRYQTSHKAKLTRDETQDIRKYGYSGSKLEEDLRKERDERAGKNQMND